LCFLIESNVEDKSVCVGEELRLEVSNSDWQRGLLNEGHEELNVLFIPQNCIIYNIKKDNITVLKFEPKNQNILI